MHNYSRLILGEDSSQSAPVCNGQVKEMVEEIEALRELVLAVRAGDWEIRCNDVSGQNWFDRRCELVGE